MIPLFIYITIFSIDIACLGLSIYLGDGPQEYFEEGGGIDWLSCAHLVFLAGISLCSMLVIEQQEREIKSRKRKMVFWALCCIGFLYLGADDSFRFHERLDFRIHGLLSIKETPFTDRLDDLIVLIYGIMAGLFLIAFHKEFLENKTMKTWLLIAAFLFVLMSLFDLISNDNYLYQFIVDDRSLDEKIGMWLGIIEDSFKIFAEAAFVVAFLDGFQSLLKKNSRGA